MVTGLAVEDLWVSYPGRGGPREAVRGVDLAVATGEILCVLGPSGSGKSTLLRAVTGLVTLERGTIRWDGEDLSQTPVHQRRFGLMFQDHALFPHTDVGGNVAFGLRMARMARRAIGPRVAEVLEMVGLGGYEDRAVDELSGGEQQRVALARALAPDPRLLLLDEPLGALDRALRDRLVSELRALFQELGTTVMYVTHDQDEAVTIADRIAVMRAGAIEQLGAPLELWRRPRNEFVARFLGATNLLTAPLRQGVVTLPFATVPVPSLDDGDVTVVVRRDALVIDDDGGVIGVVKARRFSGDVLTARVSIGDLEVDVGLDVEPAPEVGDRVRLRLDSSRLLVLGPAGGER